MTSNTGSGMHKKQKLLVKILTAVGSLVAVVSAICMLESLCHLRYAENLILREEQRSESFWDVAPTQTFSSPAPKHTSLR